MTDDLQAELTTLSNLADAHLCRTTPARVAQPGRASAGSLARPTQRQGGER
jgi:hypothetical protein